MDEQGTNPLQVARKAGLNYTAVYDLLQGRSTAPAYDVIGRIADAFKVDIAYLVGHDDERRNYIRIPVVGYAETGAWRTTDWTNPLRMAEAPPNPLYPDAEHFALEIADNSMNAVQPLPLVPGMLAFCANMRGAQLPIESGRLYVFRIRDELGKKVQTIIRRLHIQSSEHYELIAESTHTSYENQTFNGAVTSNPIAKAYAAGFLYHLTYDFMTPR